MGALCSDPASNASAAANVTAQASDAQIQQEEQYVNTAEGQLRGAIAGLGPNPYFTAPPKPNPVDPSKSTNFFTPGPPGTAGATAPQPSQNLFAAPSTRPRQAQPVQRAPAAAAQ